MLKIGVMSIHEKTLRIFVEVGCSGKNVNPDPCHALSHNVTNRYDSDGFNLECSYLQGG